VERKCTCSKLDSKQNRGDTVIIVSEKAGILGVFKDIQELTDRLVCDNRIEFPYSAIGTYHVSEDDALMPAPVIETSHEEKKSAREVAVNRIQITISDGRTFDGDEQSQSRMSRAIATLNYLAVQLALETPVDLTAFSIAYTLNDGVYRAIWVLADNTPTYVTARELSEALALAGATQAAIWVLS
jgi:hypothetical protein